MALSDGHESTNCAARIVQRHFKAQLQDLIHDYSNRFRCKLGRRRAQLSSRQDQRVVSEAHYADAYGKAQS